MPEEKVVTRQQLQLFTLSTPDEAPQQRLQGFAVIVPKQDKDGNTKRLTLGLIKRKDIAEATGLKGKANAAALDKRILELRDDLKAVMAKEVVGMISNDRFTGSKMTVVRLASGLDKVNFEFVTVPFGARGPSDEQIAQSWGITVEEVRARRQEAQQKAAAEAKAKAEAAEAEAKAKELAAGNPAPTLSPEEQAAKDAAELAEMEAAEAAARAAGDL